MKKRALLIVGLALLMATAGVVYAHWTDTLQVNAQVTTGFINIQWMNIFTDDDNGNVIGEELNLPAPKFGAGSVDPSGPGYAPGAAYGVVIPAPRYDKAIGNCSSGITDGVMTVNASNVYPSYNCTIWSQFNVIGPVPVKLQSITTTVMADYDGPGGVAPVAITPGTEIEWATLNGTLCGQQMDPNEVDFTVNWFHVLQTASQQATYTLQQTQNWVNWNEWDVADCTNKVNGFEVVPAWGIEP